MRVFNERLHYDLNFATRYNTSVFALTIKYKNFNTCQEPFQNSDTVGQEYIFL